MIIGGEPVHAQATYSVTNPSDLSTVGEAPLASTDDLDRAVAAARAAQPGWAAKTDAARADACRDVAKAIEAESAGLARLLTLEQGKPLKGLGSEFELGGCVAWMGAVADFSLPVKTIQDDEKGLVEVHRIPVGVIGSITPWNWPLMIAVWHIASAIRTGNTVVIKPSEMTPLSTLKMVEIMNRVLPAGVVNAVSGKGDIGGAMSAHDGINKIIFTGSTATGKKIMRSAADNLKRLTLELGGNDPGIVLPGTDVNAIAEGIFWGSFINGGQTCAALKRLYVHDDQYDDMCTALSAIAEKIPMGDGLDEANMLGPLQNKAQYDKVIALVEDAKKQGARVLTGGAPMDRPGYFYPVTLLADAKDGMGIVDEEQFGTALPIIRYTDLDDAIARANGLDYGLAASVWGNDPNEARRVAERINAGTVYINQHGAIAPHIPFGGVKGSGIGVEFGVEGLEACTDVKVYNMLRTS